MLSRSSRTHARTVQVVARGIITYRRPLVGPPDAVSNLRPALYGPPREVPSGSSPYSLTEFPSGDTRLSDEEEGDALRWRLQQEQLDAFNQAFWVDNNVRFQTAKQAVLDQYPPLAPSSSPDELDIREIELEQALVAFYAHWVERERARNYAYTWEWYRRNYSSLWPAIKREWKMRISDMKEEDDAKWSLGLMLHALARHSTPKHRRKDTQAPSAARKDAHR